MSFYEIIIKVSYYNFPSYRNRTNDRRLAALNKDILLQAVALPTELNQETHIV